MIRKLLATTAIATLVATGVATGAYAQDTTAPAPAPVEPAPMTDSMTDSAAPVVRADGHLATQIIGETVYNGAGEDAAKIGGVNDIVIGPDGTIQSVVVGVGGFLGIGEKKVALDYAKLDWAEKDGDRWLVTPVTKEQLEQQAAFDARAYEPVQTTSAADPAAPVGVMPAEPTPDVTADAPATGEPMDQMAEDAPEATASPDTTAAIDKSTLTEMPGTEIRAEEMIGTTVYGADDVRVGEIGDVVMSTDGKIDAYIVDVGGFLGMGEKEVAVSGDNLAFLQDTSGKKYLYTTLTKEQLDAAAAYDKATYVEKRDDQRLMVR